MTLFIDNYDSFSYMLADYLTQLGLALTVIRNDEWNLDRIQNFQPSAIIISPGPEVPSRSGIVMEVIHTFYQQIPLLGICLGHQALGEFFGAKLTRSRNPVHGKIALVNHSGHPVFDGIPNPFQVMRYHSLELKQLPPELTITCRTTDGIIMGLQHVHWPLTGFQFHPESILTHAGLRLLHNWVSLYIGATHWQSARQ